MELDEVVKAIPTRTKGSAQLDCWERDEQQGAQAVGTQATRCHGRGQGQPLVVIRRWLPWGAEEEMTYGRAYGMRLVIHGSQLESEPIWEHNVRTWTLEAQEPPMLTPFLYLILCVPTRYASPLE